MEVAERLGVKLDTAHKWVQRDVLPLPDFTVSGMRAWHWSTILRWAGDTGRIIDPTLATDYAALMDCEPSPPRRQGRRANGHTSG